MRVSVGDKIKVISIEGRPEYTGRIGIVTKVEDDIIVGTWGAAYIIYGEDKFQVLSSKRRALKPWAQKTLVAITIFLGMTFCMIDDFELRAIPIMLVWFGIIGLNIVILDTFGRENI